MKLIQPGAYGNRPKLQQEDFSINVGVSAVGPYPLAAGVVSVSAHMGPISTSQYYPRYEEGNCETVAVSILRVWSRVPDVPVPGDYDGDKKVDVGTAAGETVKLGPRLHTDRRSGKIWQEERP